MHVWTPSAWYQDRPVNHGADPLKMAEESGIDSHTHRTNTTLLTLSCHMSIPELQERNNKEMSNLLTELMQNALTSSTATATQTLRPDQIIVGESLHL